MNPYQRIIKDGSVIQQGHIDTQKKFAKLVSGISLRGKRVVDIGCNLGMMCELARQHGADVYGIDIEKEYIEDAKKLWPNICFGVEPAERLRGNWDIAILSATFHYFTEPERVLKQLARCCDLVIGDFIINIDSSKECRFTRDHRKLWIPNEAAFTTIAKEYFDNVVCIGPSPSPDDSTRFFYHLSQPKKTKAEALCIGGEGGTGKTTYAKTFYDRDILQIDQVFIEWRILNIKAIMSVAWHADSLHGKCLKDYLQHHLSYIERWAISRTNLNIAIEGYDFVYDDFRIPVIEMLEKHGWEVRYIKLV